MTESESNGVEELAEELATSPPPPPPPPLVEVEPSVAGAETPPPPDSTPFEKPEPATAAVPELKKRPALAAVLSLFTGGIGGYLYLGLPKAALVSGMIFFTSVVVDVAAIGVFVLAFVVFDAIRQAQLINEGLEETSWHDRFDRRGLGVLLVVIGSVLLLNNLLPGWLWRMLLQAWPLLLIALGAWLYLSSDDGPDEESW